MSFCAVGNELLYNFYRRRVDNVTTMLQLNVLASHKPNLDILRPGNRELSLPKFGGGGGGGGGCNFLSDPCLFGCIFKEKVPIKTFHISS